MIVQVFRSVRCEIKPFGSCLTSFVRKLNQNGSLGAPKRGVDQLEDEAIEWLANLSPEMKQKKIQLEQMLDDIREENYQVNNIDISAADMKHMMADCKGYKATKKYVLKKARIAAVKLKAIEKRKERENDEKSIVKEEDNKDKSVVSGYTILCHQQRQRLDKNNKSRTFMFDALPVVFDVGYNLSIHEQILTERQLMICACINRNFTEPCQMHVTSFLKNELLDVRNRDSLLTDKMIVHEASFEEIFPREKLVYLSPHAPQLRYHNPGDIYVLGGLVDQEPNKPLSLEKAWQKQIRCGSIPFRLQNATPNMVQGISGYILNLDAVFQLILNVNLIHDWKYVIRDFISTRRTSTHSQIVDLNKKIKDFL